MKVWDGVDGMGRVGKYLKGEGWVKGDEVGVMGKGEGGGLGNGLKSK